uniref:Isopropylmalate/isohomocitrate dehydrogenase (LeuB) n=1 Tax=uncultured marine thaumarchaeote SAT1000_06_F08 TaxID=1456362 RepID=A0A075I5E6_9ARCH|nr:isopropylmalate/isohomocitrate dehydrogenase (leuB) [uncultured marine thaumarchaeote SAT1000_06_F08]
MFARTCSKVANDFPGVKFEEMYVDACAMNLIRQPQSFDVIVTTNLFGDILSDEAAQVVGGLGMVPAANIGDNFGLFEPVHGAAFDIAGKHIANPTSFILSIKMMLEWLGNKHDDQKCIEIGQKLESVIYDLAKIILKQKILVEIKLPWSLLKKLSQGFNLSGSLGYKITSLTLSIPRIIVSSLSSPNPHPACGGIPQSNACK